MKTNKLMRYFAACAWICAAACSKDAVEESVIPAPAADGALKVVVADDSSRAEFYNEVDGSFRVRYNTDDRMLLWHTGRVADANYYYTKCVEAASAKIDAGNHTAEFTYSGFTPFQVGDPYPGLTKKFTEVYYSGLLPASAFKGIVSGQTPSSEGSGNNIFLSIPRDQKPTNASPDPAAILVRADDATQPENGVIKTRFSHILAYMRVTVKGLAEGKELQKIEISTGSGTGLADAWIPGGVAEPNQTNRYYCHYDLDRAMGISPYSDYYNRNGFSRVPGNRIDIDASALTPDADGCYTVWVGCAPVRLLSTESCRLCFRVYTTDGEYIDKYVPVTNEGSAGSITLQMGRAAVFTLNFGNSKELSAPVVSVRENEYQLTGEHAGKTKLTFAWTSVLNSDRFVYKLDGGSETQTAEQSLTLYVEPESQHSFAVKAIDTQGVYTESAYTSIETAAAELIHVLAAPAVTVDQASVTASSFIAAWTAVEGATSYSYKLDEGPATETAEFSHLFANLTDDTAYTVSVQALSTKANYTAASEWKTVTVTTLKDSRRQLAEPVVSAAPTAKKVVLTWTAVPDATGYVCKVGETGTEYTVAAPETTCTIEGLDASTNYTAYVMAVDATGACKSSGWGTVSFSTPAPNQPTLSWNGTDFAGLDLTQDSESNGLHYKSSTKNASYDSGNKMLKLGGGGSVEDGRSVWFTADKGPGTVRIKAVSSSTSSTRYLAVNVDGVELAETLAVSTAVTGEIECPTAKAGSVIYIYSKGSGINIYTIEWIPAE